MKAIILTVLMVFSINSLALATTPDKMSIEHQTQLIKILNQLEPEMLDTILNDEALEWYINAFSRGDSEDFESFEFTNEIIKIGGNFKDPNAPKFN